MRPFETPSPFDRATFVEPPRAHGILPFWFLNGELDPAEMRRQLAELADKGMAGVVLHARYGLEMPYLGERYLEAIRLATDEAARLGFDTWIYDEINWPSGTAGGRVLEERPDLQERYIECIHFEVSGPWFQFLTGGDDRYLPLGRSTPVAAFAIREEDGHVVDVTPSISFGNVVPWQVPPGRWRVCYVVEKRAEHYVDALDPEATAEFLRLGYEPYLGAIGGQAGESVLGFYTDEPAMYYHLSGQNNACLPWTKDLLARFRERNGYDLRPELPSLFFDVNERTPRVRFDFHSTLTELYSQAYFGQIGDWCRRRGLMFTGHLLYEESPRQLIRAAGNPFAHYRQLDVIGVDHLYPVVGSRFLPSQNVALKLASSAAHQLGSERVLCESYGGLFVDATLQRLKWITDWQCALGVNLINPHGYHYTLEGARKRDWPPSMFYQYPWWRHYGAFQTYVRRLSTMLTGGRHVSRIALLWPMTSLYATYRPQERGPVEARIEDDFTALSEILLRIHHDYDVLDEGFLADARVVEGALAILDERYELVVLPPLTHLRLETVARLELFVAAGGRLLASGFLPTRAFDDEGGEVDVADRVGALFCDERGILLENEGLVADDDEARFAIAEDVRAAVEALVVTDVRVSNPDLLCLHRVKDGRGLWFFANPTFEPQAADVAVRGSGQPLLWDPDSGDERPLVPSRADGDLVRFSLELPPAGSAFVLLGEEPACWVVGGNVELEHASAMDDTCMCTHAHLHVCAGPPAIRGLASEARAFIEIERDGVRETLEEVGEPVPAPIVLGGEWRFEAVGGNALVLDELEVAPAGAELPSAGDWRPIRPGVFAFQAEEPADAVWYRALFTCERVPRHLDLLVDGFACSEWVVHLNGVRVTTTPRPSDLDCQIAALELGPFARPGENVLELRLELAGEGDGLLDPLKLVGDFELRERDGRLVLVRPSETTSAAPWDELGYPRFSGEGVYRRTFEPGEITGLRVFLEPQLQDDVVEVVVNGISAGVRLWAPYRIEVTELLRSGENELELRVSNTLGNLFDAPRRSGLTGAPQLVFARPVELGVPEAAAEAA